MSLRVRTMATFALVFAAGCGGPSPKGEGEPVEPAKGTTPAATGKVITIELITDGTGNFFKPNEIEAHPGDILRFTLTIGVHNVHFVADSNPGVPNLPEASDMLQLPGQTFDVVVPDAVGKRLYFQCDPHALLGMVGHVKVEG